MIHLCFSHTKRQKYLSHQNFRVILLSFLVDHKFSIFTTILQPKAISEYQWETTKSKVYDRGKIAQAVSND